jgi:hypothetical protein
LEPMNPAPPVTRMDIMNVSLVMCACPFYRFDSLRKA